MIEAEKLTMHYGPVVALKDASFTVNQGEVVGLLGPNGAGKSTAMKILTTFLYPTSGTARVCGKDVREVPLEVRKRIGSLPEVPPLYMDMEVKTYLEFVGRARRLDGSKLKSRLDWVVDKTGLRPMLRKLIIELSKGFRQRTALAQALIHDPEVIILDEPTSGLDPHQIIEIRHLIRELAETKTVILSTHILQEVEAVSDRLLIISNGKIVADGTVDDLRKKAMNDERTLVSVAAAKDEVKSALGTLVDSKKIEFLKEEDGYSYFHLSATPGTRLWREIGDLANEQGWKIGELKEHTLSLEETFLALTESEYEVKGDAA